MPAKKFLTPSEYATKHGLFLNYVYTLIRAGKLPAQRVDGRYKIPAGAIHLKFA